MPRALPAPLTWSSMLICFSLSSAIMSSDWTRGVMSACSSSSSCDEGGGGGDQQ